RRRAEVERAEAQVRAEEERKRLLVERQKRRATRNLAALAVIFLLAALGAGLWYYHDFTERALENALAEGREAQRKEYLEKEIEKELAEAREQHDRLQAQLADPLQASQLLSDIDGWKARVARAGEAWKRAHFLADSGKDLLDGSWSARLEALKKQVDSADRDWRMAKRLD